MRIGFIGLGNVGGKLAGSLLRNSYDLTVRDLDREAARQFLDAGAAWADSPREMAEACDVVVTCLPSPAACSTVMEADDGILAGLSADKVWMEMSTTRLRFGGWGSWFGPPGPSRWTVRSLGVVTGRLLGTSPSSPDANARPSIGSFPC